jgi:hypothetical protein
VIGAAVFVVAAGVLLGVIKSWHRCPICDITYPTGAHVYRHIRKAHHE